jgi:uncharacterized heparinase superfamily protein
VSGAWTEPARLPASMLGPGTFRFLNDERSLGPPIDWAASGTALLWRYNLHYFDDLNAIGARERHSWHRDLIASWIAHNPPAGGVGWDSYPTSLRVVNWIKWELAGATLDGVARDSLAKQTRWLRRRIEWHLLGNHLFADAKALAFAGCFFAGAEADEWLRVGTRIIERELGEQVLPDGGNFELSPMYHSIFLADLLDLVNIGRTFPGRIPAALDARLRETTSRMLGWLRAMVHPDGEIAMFNDCALGIAPSLPALAAYAARLGVGIGKPRAECTDPPSLTLMAESGYARLESAEAVALCDVARIGPDYLPGHAHADTLSFELSIAGERFVVNGGTSCYGSDDLRVRERGTAAHSTVVVDEANSSEVWGGFRVARRAYPIISKAYAEGGTASLVASHDGYRRLQRDIVHHRCWELTRDTLKVDDRVSGRWNRAYAQFLLHRDVEADEIAPGVWRLRNRKLPDRVVTLTVTAGVARLAPAFHSLEFGRRLPTSAIHVELGEAGSSVEIGWRSQ